MVLYYARGINDPGGPDTNSILLAIQNSSASWRKCFGEVRLLGGNLTETEDVYVATPPPPPLVSINVIVRIALC
jgi:hypothetical protein